MQHGIHGNVAGLEEITEDIELHNMRSANTVTEPLINEAQRRGQNDVNDGSHGSSNPNQNLEDDESKSLKPTTFVWILVFVAGISGLLFGYDTGVISSTLVFIHSDLSNRPLTTIDKSLITSSTSFLALIASPCTGFLADILGRKRVIYLASLLFILGALWQALCSTVWAMILGRGIVGLAIGSASFVVPLYIGELSPSRFRGRLVTVSTLFITAGQVIAYVVGWALSTTNGGWRWLVGLGVLPAAIQLLLLIAMPETPRWLVMAEREDDAAMVLKRVYGDEAGMQKTAATVLRRIQEELKSEVDKTPTVNTRHRIGLGLELNSTITDLFTIGGNRRALAIACLLQGSQQLCGFNSLMYFSATIFATAGFTSPTLTSLSIAITNFLFTLITFRFIDRIGRRRILLLSIPFMIGGLILCAIAFNFLDLHVDMSATEPPTSGSSISSVWSSVLLVSLIIYVSAYALGLGNVPWQQSELFSLSVRSVGSGLATATNWGSNTLVGLTFLPMMEILTPSWTFVVYACICFGSWICIWWRYPETAGLGLEEVGILLKDGWGVEESLEIWGSRKRS